MLQCCRKASRIPYSPLRSSHLQISSRPFFRWALKGKKKSGKDSMAAREEDDAFHALSSSPFPDLRARAKSIKRVCKCPACAAKSKPVPVDTQTESSSAPKLVNFECPECGYPTHCTEEHWREDTEHSRYCGKLREVNEDDHDLRGRREKYEYYLPST